MRSIVAVTALLGIIAAPALAAEHSRPIKSIYIGSFVSGLDEVQFRTILKDELVKAGFEVAETA
ncbi:MAG TPA: hypothetical protein VN203_24000, partial [Candidatus Acidoferrum sp.]|nr:hypothetical protein [Candidatus Acidoferrum sp.]